MTEQNSQSVRAEAADAFAAMRNPESPGTLLDAIRSRRGSDPEFDNALAEYEALWSNLGELADRPSTAVAAGGPVASASNPATDKPARRNWLPFAAAAVLALLSVAVLWPRGPETAAETWQAATAVAEQSELDLRDGSTIFLNSNSAITVTYSERRRLAEFDQGQALFAVEPSLIPFVVQTGDVEVEVLGTEFEVFADDLLVTVTVTDGEVRVRRRSGSGAARFEIARGQQIEYDRRSRQFDEVNSIEPGSVARWRDGVMVFDHTPLPAALRQASQFIDGKMVAGDERTRNYRVSGTFDIDDIDRFTATLTQSFPLAQRRENGQTVLVSIQD
ncbi:MAG: FecR domain-containing protein [Pseudomonadota bacterium]